MALASLPEDLAATIDLALAERDRIPAAVSEAVGEGLSDLWFVGAGGSHFTSSHVGALMAAKGTSVPTFRVNSNEFVYDTPVRLGPDSLVVVTSHNGTTPETIKAIETARSRGVRAVLAVSRDPESPLATDADHAFVGGAPFKPQDRLVWCQRQGLEGGLLVGEGLVDDTKCRRMDPWICDRIEPMPQLAVQVVQISE